MWGIYEYAADLSSGAMINKPVFIKIRSGTQKVMGGGGGVLRHAEGMEIA
jgi:hypothetical protein